MDQMYDYSWGGYAAPRCQNSGSWVVVILLVVICLLVLCGCHQYDYFDPNYEPATDFKKDFTKTYQNHGDNIPVTNRNATPPPVPMTNTINPDKRRDDLIRIGNIDDET